LDGLSAHRIIIVDDDPSVGTAIKEVAERRGLAVAWVTDSHQLREIYQSFAPSLVFLDLHLPGGEDGVELLRFLAQQGRRPKLILMSGSGAKVLSTVARLARFHGLDLISALEKPIAPADLEQLLAQACGCDRLIEEGDLRAALASGELTLHYQPKVNLQSSSTCAIDAVEALIRWPHPKYGDLRPDQFLPLVGAFGMFKELTDFVVLEAATQARRWHEAGLNLTVAINLPAELLGDLELADRIDHCLRSLKLPSSQLVLEVTESGVMADLAKAMETLTRLRLKGLMLSMDDFGTGYSSLVQLYQLPFSELKIDRAFIVDLTRSTEAQIIVRSVIDLAHNLGMQVCAEGLEDAGAVEILQAWGCERAQGFLFAPALPSARLEALLRDQEGTLRRAAGPNAHSLGSGHDQTGRASGATPEAGLR
jgi:EAL domain-containing protein (putative c-di-GMP-specific phosphodiesterase class I)/ActR/RegA family two-component response regulator